MPTSNNNHDTFSLMRLAEEIEALNVAAMTQPDDTEFWAQKLKLAAIKIQERELLLEKHRVDQVKQAYEEKRRCSYKPEEEDCPICLETMHGFDIDNAPHFVCCGKFTCDKCPRPNKIDKCPLCRAPLPRSVKEHNIALQKLAQSGNAWARFQLAEKYNNGTDGFEANDALAFQWYHRAAEQGFSFARIKVAGWYLDDDDIPGHKGDYAEASRWCQATLDTGHQCDAIMAMDLLGMLKFDGEGDHKEAVRVFTLIIAYSPDSLLASFHLGLCFAFGKGELPKSLDRAKYYLEKVVQNVDPSSPGYAQHLYATTLQNLAIERYHGRIYIPGHCIVPQVLYWLRKAVAVGYDQVSELIEPIEQDMKSRCANCQRDADEFTDMLKCCHICRAVCYCGRACQLAHWRRGHKFDCIKSDEKQDMKRCCANCQRDADEFTDKLKCCIRCRAVWYCGKACQVAHWRRGHKIDCVKSDKK